MNQTAGTTGPGTAVAESVAVGAGVTSLPEDDFDRGVFATIDDYLEGHPGGQERLIPVLHRAQEQIGYLPVEVQEHVARALGMSPVTVYGVISFYHFFTTVPRGRFQLKVCTGTACFVRRSNRLLDALRDVLGLEIGGLTEDRLFSLEEVRCLGACGLAPAMMVNSDVHGNLTPERVRNLIRALTEQAGAPRGEDGGE